MRVQRLAEAPDPSLVLAVLPESSAPIGREHLERSGPTIETVCSADLHERESRSRCPTRAATSWTSPPSKTAPSSTTT